MAPELNVRFMPPRTSSVCATGLAFFFAGSSLARAGPLDSSLDSAPGGNVIRTFTLFDHFRSVLGAPLEAIDFETLPDGSPSIPGTLITPDFNYTEFGATFSSPIPELRISAPLDGRLGLRASANNTSLRNWIIADLVVPAFGVGIFFPGGTTLSAFDESGQLLATAQHAQSGNRFFVGIISETPISRITVNRGGSTELIDSFHFAPVPEPWTVVLLSLGVGVLTRRTRRSRKPR